MEEFWIGHRERLRRRAESEGWDVFRSYELIELILYYAVPRQDVNDVARNLINTFGTVQAVLDASPDKLFQVPGVTRGMVEWIMITSELVHAYAAIEPDEHFRILRYRNAIDFIVPGWRNVHPPECWMIYTDFDNRLLMRTVLCDSLAWSEPEYVRQAMREALALQARHAFLVMFMGVLPLEIDASECENLLRFSRAMRGIDVELLDCILVGESGFVSLNRTGKMDNIRHESLDLALHERYSEE